MSGSMSRVNESFAKRFEPDGDGYLFRKTLRAEGVRVTVAERDRFVADFRRWTRISTWGVVALMILLMVGGVFALDSSGATFPEYLLYIPMAACFALFLALYSWLWNAPVRALKTRQVEASGRTKDEARRLALQRVTWGQLGIGALAAPLVLLRVGARQNLLVGWSRLWILATVLLLILVGVQAVRKWRMERGSPGKVD